MAYVQRNLHLSKCQLERLKRAIENDVPISFSKYTSGEFQVPALLTDGQNKNFGNKTISFSKKQLRAMSKDGGFLGAILNVLKAIAPVAKTVAKVAVPAVATGALTGLSNWGAQKAAKTIDKKVSGKGLKLKPYRSGSGLYLPPYIGKNLVLEFTPRDINTMIEPKSGGFIGTLIGTLASMLLPSLLGGASGSGLNRQEHEELKKIFVDVASQKSKNRAQQRLNHYAEMYSGSGLLGKALGLPNGKIPILSSIPLLGALF